MTVETFALAVWMAMNGYVIVSIVRELRKMKGGRSSEEDP